LQGHDRCSLYTAQVGWPALTHHNDGRDVIAGKSVVERTAIRGNIDRQPSGPAHQALGTSAKKWLADRRSPVRIELVLSGGGLRGASHVGVLQQLMEHDIAIDVIVGSSAGAVIAAYYAAVGLTISELIHDAENFRGRHLLAHCLNVRLHGRLIGTLSKLS